MQPATSVDSSGSEFTRGSIGAAIAAAAGSAVSIAPIVVSTFSVFLANFVKQYGWGRGSVSLAITICALVGGAFTPLAGRILDRFGVRRVMLPAVVLFGLAVMAVSLADGVLWQIYLFYGLIGITASFQNMVAYSKVASLWFHRRRGMVLSLVSACYGLSAAMMPKFVQPLIARHGWQAGYIFLGCVVLSSLIVLIPLLRLPPGAEGAPHAAQAALHPGLTVREARGTRSFWLLFAVLFLAVLSIVGTLSQIFPMMLDRGIAPPSAASVLTVFFLGTMTGQLTYGFLVDWIDSPRVALPFFVCALIGMTTLHNVSSLPLLFPAAFLMGVGQGSELGLAAYFSGRYFGLRNLGAIYGFIYAGATVASGLGPFILGLSFDLAHSYRPMMIAFEAALLLATCGVAMLGPYVYAARRANR
jgi:MFS family permease